ncbi:MAG: ABC transporter ATP-binding protein [Acidimicrobiia bacterium]
MHTELAPSPAGSPVGPSSVVSTRHLTKHYRSTPALESLDLEVAAGSVLGYLGPNGAGKTTTIRLLMGLLRPTSGSATVLGFDIVTQRCVVQSKVGYLPGSFVAYPDLTARDYLDYLANLRGRIDPARMLEYADRLELPLDRQIGDLSHGNRQKVGLVQAFMHDPELLILDEPTTGLDPLVQREFLTMVREVRDAGRTVFLSSHILAEVEAVADIVAILRSGRLIVTERLETLKARATHRIEIDFAGPVDARSLSGISGVRQVVAAGSSALVTVEGSAAELFRRIGPLGVERVRTHEADLEDIFLSHYSPDVEGRGHEAGRSL